MTEDLFNEVRTTQKRARAKGVQKQVDIPTDVVDRLAAVSAEDPVVLAIDPGSTSTGIALVEGGRCIFSTQGRPADVCREYAMIIGLDKHVDVVAREMAYTRNRGEKASRAGESGLYVQGFACGWISCAFRRVIANAALWEPLPPSWRSVLGLNRQKTASRTARDETNDAVWMWAKATTKLPLVGTGGGRRFDEANAIALAYAARSITRGVRLLNR